MSGNGKFHINVHIDSLHRQPGGTPWNFVFQLNKEISVPSHTIAFMSCTRWSIDTSQIPLRADRSGKSLKLIIPDIAGSSDVIDMGRNGATLPCVAYISTIDNARNVARTTSATSHPVLVPSGVNLRQFRCQVQDNDGNIANLKNPSTGSGGEWQADLLIVLYT